MNSFYYIAEVREPDTCKVCGYVVKDAATKRAIQSPPIVFGTREKAEAYLEGMLSAMA